MTRSDGELCCKRYDLRGLAVQKPFIQSEVAITRMLFIMCLAQVKQNPVSPKGDIGLKSRKVSPRGAYRDCVDRLFLEEEFDYD